MTDRKLRIGYPIIDHGVKWYPVEEEYEYEAYIGVGNDSIPATKWFNVEYFKTIQECKDFINWETSDLGVIEK